MRHLASAALCLLLMLGLAGAKDKKQYSNGRLLDVRTQKLKAKDFQSRDAVNDKNGGIMGSMSTTGGPFTNDKQVLRYSMIISTDTEMIYLSCDRESASAQPELKNDMEIKWRPSGENNIEILDAKGKKFNLELLRRVAKDAPTLKAPPRVQSASPAK